MESNQSYKTAYNAAYARLIEQHEPDSLRLFNDPYVSSFFGKNILFQLKHKPLRSISKFMYNISMPGIFGLQVCRTKYIDEKLASAIMSGIEQIVILGAGFDTRSQRFSKERHIKIFELDLPYIQIKKEKTISKFIGKLPDNVIYAPIDFNSQEIDEVLTSKGLDLSKPIFFVWEGVTQYITKEAVENTLRFISGTPAGSQLVFTYILENIINRTTDDISAINFQTVIEMSEQKWQFGIDPSKVSEFVRPYRLSLIEDVGADYISRHT